ncbi:hypothetical protein [Microbacterium sp. LWH3-1.2]|uniref:hypothetical protein n=1 Tax=Microbacterium sp. LWH3-1.2 TaxID=3135256 RepID=UPI0034359A48
MSAAQSEYLAPQLDPSPPRPELPSSDPREELARAERDYGALLDLYERRNPASGPRSRWAVSAERYALARARLDAARRAVDHLGRV